ncbi:hypothetical protein ACP70R_040016 [Stipagrostis hirtigluma subsp. patula]
MGNVQVKLPSNAGVAAPGDAPAPEPPMVLPTVTICCAACPGDVLAIKRGFVGLAQPKPRVDASQHWEKDDHWGHIVVDVEGRPAFALVNKATKQAIQRPDEEWQPVRLVPYSNSVLDRSVLWTEKYLPYGFCSICEVDDVNLVFNDALQCMDTMVVVSRYEGTNSQKWMIKRDKQ